MVLLHLFNINMANYNLFYHVLHALLTFKVL